MAVNPPLQPDRARQLARQIIEQCSDEKVITCILELVIGIANPEDADRYTAAWMAARELYNHSSECEKAFEAFIKGEHVIDGGSDSVS